MPYYTKIIDSPLGLLKLISDEQNLKSIVFDAQMEDSALFLPDVLSLVQTQLEEYFSGIRQRFELPLDPQGTDFQLRVWSLLKQVEYGSQKSYLTIARELGSQNSSRAVGMANGRNPIPIIIPCHRIVGLNGKLTGYSGGLDRKKWLLLHEQKFAPLKLLF
jgi:methylated-DNA-[protein]-cysteine S-methyltransferase